MGSGSSQSFAPRNQRRNLAIDFINMARIENV